MINKKLAIISSILVLLLSGCVPKRNPALVVPLEAPQDAKIENIGVALVLGGGGSRGIAHIGVLEVLEENSIPIDLIVGSSAGSAIGAIYADSKSVHKTKDAFFKAKRNKLLDFSLANMMKTFIRPTPLVKGQAYENFIYDNLKAKDFSELEIPLVVVTTDSVTGEKFEINSGPIAPAVRASSAIPPLIEPVPLYHRKLFDGGIVEPVPVTTAKKYNPKFIIAINISAPPENSSPNNVLDLTYKAFWISYYRLARMQVDLADIEIHPDMNGHGIVEDHRKEELYQLGKKAALVALPEIKRRLKRLGLNK